ncbi:MAG: sigma-70 family RNA polymerase sigma factor [Planctomycetaceae bacterium]|nr:sigma-70 family RNA polymerase sigma factor [Planctomycetaceae bacterium]
MRPEITQHPPPHTESDSSGIVRRLLEAHLPEIQLALRAIIIKSKAWREDEIADVLGEVAKQVIQKADDYDPNRKFVPWVLGFAGYVLKARQRQRGKAIRQRPMSQLAPGANEAFWDEFVSTHQTEIEENRLRLDGWLDELDEDDRQVIELRFFHNYDGQELAEAIGAGSSGAARVRLCRAMKRLRRIAMGEEGGAA